MKFLRQFCTLLCLVAAWFATTASALEKDADGYYLLATTEDYEAFCDMVNAGAPYAPARVTADNIVVARSIGEGNYMFHYRGTFDGQGHTLRLDGADAVFASTQAGCVIANLNLTGSAVGKGTYAASLVRDAAGGTFSNCSSSASVDATNSQTAGGLIGHCRGAIFLSGCSYTGQITGGVQSAGLIGWSEHTVHLSGCSVTGPSLLVGNMTDGNCFVDNTTLNGAAISKDVAAPDGDSNTVRHKGILYTKLGDGESVSLSVKACNTGLTAIKVPSEVTIDGTTYPVSSIGQNSMSFKKLQYLQVGSGITRIENDAFNLCEGLKEVVFDDSETRLWIGDNEDATPDQEIFYNSPIEKVYIGRNLAWDGDDALDDEPFESRDELREIVFGPRVTLVGNFDDPTCTADELFNESNDVDHYAFLGDDKSLGTSVKFYCAEGMSHAPNAYISRDLEPSSYTEYTVAASGYAISDRTEHVVYGPFVTYVTPKIYSGIGATANTHLLTADFTNATRLTTIRERAFADCDNLAEADFSNINLKTIEAEAFYDCDKLATAIFNNSLEEIGRSAFDDTGLLSVNLPGSLKTLGYKAFYDCDELTGLFINPGTEDLVCQDDGGECRTFDSCSNLTRLYLGRNLVYTEGSEKASPFYDSYFKQAIIDNKVTRLGANLFQHSNRMTSLSIGEGVTSIPDNCFNETEEVTQFNIVDGDQPITLGASVSGFKAETLYVGRVITDIENIPSKDKSAMSHVQYGTMVPEVKSGSFSGYTGLKYVVLPGKITVESLAFQNCGIEQLYIQGDATFQPEAFKDCNSIDEVTVVGKVIADEDAFAPSEGSQAIKTLNVFFREDPEDSSHCNAFPASYLAETMLNNMYDTPYQAVNFTCSPWRDFRHRKTMDAHDYAPSSEAAENGRYDHAYLYNHHQDGEYLIAYFPFDVSTYYFGSGATVYDFLVTTSPAHDDGFVRSDGDNGVTLTANKAIDLDHGSYYLPTNRPLVVKSAFTDHLVQAAMSQFVESQVAVNFRPDAHPGDCATPYFVSNKDEVVSPRMGTLFVIDNGCLKMVNGEYKLSAFNVALAPGDNAKLHFRDSATGAPLMPESADVTAAADLQGYVTFYSRQSSFIAEGADVYTVFKDCVEGKNVLKLDRVDDNVITQGQAVLIKYVAGETLTMTMVTNPSSDTEAFDNNLLRGVEEDTSAKDLGDNIHVLGKNGDKVGFVPAVSPSPANAVLRANSDAIVPGGSAYIDMTDIHPDSLPFIIDDNIPTGISTVKADDNAADLYDLYGRRVTNPESGNIYVKKGSKMLKK